jgi:hypothetical protein
MASNNCARNLPQHFNGCTCTSLPGATTAEADVDLTPAAPASPPKPVVKKAADFDVDSPRYDVEIHGAKIGTVGKGWFRNGGTQWFNSVRGVLYPVGPTRQAAVEHLVRNAPKPEDWTEAFPQDSAAARVSSFKGKPVGAWFNDQFHFDGRNGDTGPASFIAPDGSYAWVHEDDEPTGHWFIDGEWADGATLDGFSDSRDAAKRQAQKMLTDGKAAYDVEQASWR